MDKLRRKPVRIGPWSPRETAVLSAVKKYLDLDHRVVWWARMNSGKGKLLRADGEGRWIEFGFTGCPDILGQLKPRKGDDVGPLLAIEVKSYKGTIKSEQQAFLSLVLDNGGVAGVVRSIDEAKRLIDRWYNQT